MSSVTSEYLISTNSYFSNAMYELKKLDEIQQISDQDEVPGLTSDDASKARPIELRRRSTKSREYWHADTIPLEKIWNHMKDALIIVDDFTRMLFVCPIKDKTIQLLRPSRSISTSNGQNRQESRVSTSSSIARF